MTNKELTNFLQNFACKKQIHELKKSSLSFLSQLIIVVLCWIIVDHTFNLSNLLRWVFFLSLLVFTFVFIINIIKKVQRKINLLYLSREIENHNAHLKSCFSHSLNSGSDDVLQGIDLKKVNLPLAQISKIIPLCLLAVFFAYSSLSPFPSKLSAQRLFKPWQTLPHASKTQISSISPSPNSISYQKNQWL